MSVFTSVNLIEVIKMDGETCLRFVNSRCRNQRLE